MHLGLLGLMMVLLGRMLLGQPEKLECGLYSAKSVDAISRIWSLKPGTSLLLRLSIAVRTRGLSHARSASTTEPHSQP